MNTDSNHSPEAFSSNNASESVRVDAPLTDSKPEKHEGITIHSAEKCKGSFCPFHNPSDHPLKDAPKHIRTDKLPLVERVCKHGVGHDDPDSVAYMHSRGIDWAGVHGCDGCCSDTVAQALSTSTSSGNTTEPKPSGVMDEQLEPVIKELFDGMALNPIDYPHTIKEIKALLATEYDRGVQDGATKTMEAYTGFGKIEYDRGKVEGELRGIEWASGFFYKQLEDMPEDERKAFYGHLNQLKSKGEVNDIGS